MAFFTAIKSCSFSLIAASLGLAGCQSVSEIAITESKLSEHNTLFTEFHAVMPIEPRSRRKWDNPLIADLDQDGLIDVIITDHAHAANIMWNDEDKFSAPQLLIGGDTHGVEAFDYDNDGAMDVFYGNERGRWHLFTNNTNQSSNNDFIKIRVGKSPKQNTSAQNAVLRLSACGNNFIRFVGASSAAFSHNFGNQ